MTIKQLHDLALKTIHSLNGANGDPAKNASWANERRLAIAIVRLARRIEELSFSVDVSDS